MARYDDKTKALVKHLLEANEGNVKRVARESGVPEQTVRDWKKRWDRDGEVPESVALAIPEAVEEHTQDMKRVRQKVLNRIEAAVDDPSNKATLRDLATTYGILTDKIRLSEGKPTSHTEHSGGGAGALPVEEVRELFAGMARGMIEAVTQRRDTISSALEEDTVIDAEVVEQAPEALPAASSY